MFAHPGNRAKVAELAYARDLGSRGFGLGGSSPLFRIFPMTISSTSLRIDVEERERWRRTVSVTVPADVVREQRAIVVKKLASRIRLPGFREGKVPRSVVEKQYGDELQRQTIDRVIGEAYKTAIQDKALQPISQGEVENVDYQPEQDLTFRVSFDVRPSIQLARVGGFRVSRPKVEITAGQVDQVLDRLRDQNAVWKPVEDGGRAMEGELVTVQITQLGDGDQPAGDAQGYQLVVGEGDAIPDVENAILKLKAAESEDVTVRFPMDSPDESKRGVEQRVRIHLVDRRIKELPALDDTFARSLGDFDGVEPLTARIREDLDKEARAEAELHVNTDLLNRVLEANPFEVPGSMVDRYIATLLGDTGKVPEEAVAKARAEIRPEAETAVKRILVIDHLAEAEALVPTSEEIEQRIAEIAEAGKVTPAQARAQLQKAKRMEGLERDLTEKKVLAYLKGLSEIQDQT